MRNSWFRSIIRLECLRFVSYFWYHTLLWQHRLYMTRYHSLYWLVLSINSLNRSVRLQWWAIWKVSLKSWSLRFAQGWVHRLSLHFSVHCFLWSSGWNWVSIFWRFRCWFFHFMYRLCGLRKTGCSFISLIIVSYWMIRILIYRDGKILWLKLSKRIQTLKEGRWEVRLTLTTKLINQSRPYLQKNVATVNTLKNKWARIN